jgi:ribosomal protein S27AE
MTIANQHKPIPCPNCGTAMNHHADKLVYLCAEALTPGDGELLEEFYRCPHCGTGTSRPANFPNEDESQF